MLTGTLFRNIRYKVAGLVGYRGDLVLTREAIYYFPHTDIGQNRLKNFALGAEMIFNQPLIPIIFIIIFIITLGRHGFDPRELELNDWWSIVIAIWWVITKAKQYLKNRLRPKLTSGQKLFLQQRTHKIILDPALLTAENLDNIISEKKKRYKFSTYSLPLPMRFLLCGFLTAVSFTLHTKRGCAPKNT